MRNGCLVINSASKDFPADVDTLKTELSLKEVRELYAIINENFHATLGVPMAMSGTNSGGTTKSGSEVANGYENAYMELCGSMDNEFGVEDIAHMVGEDKVIFGTDAINLEPKYELGKVAFSPLSDSVKRKIFAENYLSVLKDSQLGTIKL